MAMKHGAFRAVVCDHWSRGGLGAVDLADAVIEASEQMNNFKMLYDLDMSINTKLNIIASEMYGAGEVELSPKVQEIVKKYESQVSL